MKESSPQSSHTTSGARSAALSSREHGATRRARIVEALKDKNLDGLMCTLPDNVLLLTGYCPVVGSSVAVATKEDGLLLLVPEDEADLAADCWADEVVLYRPSSLTAMESPLSSVQKHLLDATRTLHLQRGNIGYEAGYTSQAAVYAAMHVFGPAIIHMLQSIFPAANMVAADELLLQLASIKTACELDRIRRACAVAVQAFAHGAGALRTGLEETQAACIFRAPLSIIGTRCPGAKRADGFVYCMSGANSAKAYGAYARSRAKIIQPADLVLTHCNSYVDGYWTDITRTYCIGTLDDLAHRMYDSLFAARSAGLSAIKPGARAADVDRAVRSTLRDAGFGAEFKHPSGHGVGFKAFNPDARPRIHEGSPDILLEGMVFNLEPGIYIDGFGGMRHCDMVAVTADGVELLTDFQTSVRELCLQSTTRKRAGH